MARDLKGPKREHALRDARHHRTLEQLRKLREELARRHAVVVERRRAEDRIREERHDEFARVVRGETPDERRLFQSDNSVSVERPEIARESVSRRSTRKRKSRNKKPSR